MCETGEGETSHICAKGKGNIVQSCSFLNTWKEGAFTERNLGALCRRHSREKQEFRKRAFLVLVLFFPVASLVQESSEPSGKVAAIPGSGASNDLISWSSPKHTAVSLEPCLVISS